MSNQFYFKQSSLALVRNLNIKVVLFQAIQFNMRTQFSSIWPIDRIFSGTTTPGQSRPGSDGNEGVLAFPKVPALLEPQNQIFFMSYSGYSWRGDLTLLQRNNRCILQPQPTGPSWTLVGERAYATGDAVGVFYNPRIPWRNLWTPLSLNVCLLNTTTTVY